MPEIGKKPMHGLNTAINSSKSYVSMDQLDLSAQRGLRMTTEQLES